MRRPLQHSQPRRVSNDIGDGDKTDLVGKERSNLKTDTDISKAAEKFIGKPHFIGDKTKGWDCLNYLVDFYRDELGYDFPKEFEGFTESNYAKKWDEASDSCRLTLERFLNTLGNGISPSFLERGDLLIFKTPNFPSFPSIYLGNGNILIVAKEGAHVIPLRFYERYLVGCRRLI